jgi:predicted N-acetyltransferase YhbS
MDEEFKIRALRDDDDVSAITTLLHAAYAPLAGMGFRYLASHQNDEMTLKRLRQGFPFVGELSGHIVATITLRPSDPNSPCAWYREPGVFTFGQFGVLPSLQRRGIGLRLMEMVEQEASNGGATYLALDTSEGATHLCRWYSSLGYSLIQHISWHDTNYRSVVLSKPIKAEQGAAGQPLGFPSASDVLSNSNLNPACDVRRHPSGASA